MAPPQRIPLGSSALVLHGEVDRAVPRTHSRHTADLIAGSTLRLLPGYGHTTVLAELPSAAGILRQ